MTVLQKIVDLVTRDARVPVVYSRAWKLSALRLELTQATRLRGDSLWKVFDAGTTEAPDLKFHLEAAETQRGRRKQPSQGSSQSLV